MFISTFGLLKRFKGTALEKSLKNEIASLGLGKGQVFQGPTMVAVAKALLQSGVSYISGCQGTPVSHLLDVLGGAAELLEELGVHVEPAANEAGAAAMLAASINYPLRGAVAWNSIAGTNVASDALSHITSAGVKGGALIVLGGDYGEGASTVQERSHAIAMKSQVWLLDPRPNLTTIVDLVEKSFQLSEVSNSPVMFELRARACHLRGTFECKDNRSPKFSRKNLVQQAVFDLGSISLPPSIFPQERHKIEARLPAAIKFIQEQRINEWFEGEIRSVGIILQGGLYNAVIRSLQEVGLADAFGVSPIPLYVLNVTYPLVPDELTRFCTGKRAVLVVEEGQPNFIEDAINVILRRADLNRTIVVGKEVLPVAGEYTGEAVLAGVTQFFQLIVPDGIDHWKVAQTRNQIALSKKNAIKLLSEPVPVRLPGFCIGCPERPVFSALKLLQKELGKFHISADIGCHTLSTLAPFSMGNTVVGHGLSLSSSAGIAAAFAKRTISIMGDGGFWSQGLTTGIANALLRNDDSVLIILKSDYSGSSASPANASAAATDSTRLVPRDMESLLRVIGVTWLRTVPSYAVADMMATLREALDAPQKGLKIIIADGECQLQRQRRMRGEAPQVSARKKPTVSSRFGIDEDVCTGDRSCIRLSGCASLTLKENTDPLRDDPVTTVNDSCVGCGTCGEVAHAAALCPSFYRAEAIRNPGGGARLFDRVRRAIIARLQRRSAGAPS